ncbi:ligase-associated DNA damage response endonuclease PdeM [Flagellimonas meridianipacifica]|uniref:Putative SbcD/Mre11-related phosphoesterase/DNA ligase-associated metallophosphoesterase n=1 Tax=Flagellimonas meridianipacifica TaxID=1080225 RepID=A0A2T0MIC7_9FLAO|nr:ligase-associated DNA damage response endonuclease PdeM [Allomuricauda pacifica]PRX57313.1 putative SbcD/Mre11-related phosphoesterase/DNA ligase-associated metallophosphoesterase [Allomuricauda pacifica]
MTRPLQIKNEHFTLHPIGGVFWRKKSLLLISDVHLGKVAHFRKFGAAVPRKAVHKNYVLLDEIVNHFNPFQICFLGDLFHSSLNKEWELFENWVAKTPSEIILVSGNHDIISPHKFEQLGIPIFEELLLENFLLTHHPAEREEYFNFCGHIHPAVRLQGFGRQRLKLPCFFKTDFQMILPAFGKFTGTHVLQPKKNDEVFVIVEDEVVKI